MLDLLKNDEEDQSLKILSLKVLGKIASEENVL